MLKLINGFLRDQSGATSIEYGLIASLIFLVILASMTAFGSEVSGLFDRASNVVAAATS
ncbi:MAG TPA: Flp family type IVb pilin [Brevundimonas sp.]|jgi:pilus assembly protein Flp/PilA